MAVPQSRTQRPLAPTPTGSTKRPKRPHGRPSVCIAGPFRGGPPCFNVHACGCGFHVVPLGIQTGLPMPFAAMTAQHRIQSPHVQILQLGDTPILTKTALDPRFLDFLETHGGRPYGTSWQMETQSSPPQACAPVGRKTTQPIWVVRSPRRCRCQTGAHRMWCCAAHSSPRGRTTGARAFVVGGPTGRNPSAPEPLDLGWKSTCRDPPCVRPQTEPSPTRCRRAFGWTPCANPQTTDAKRLSATSNGTVSFRRGRVLPTPH